MIESRVKDRDSIGQSDDQESLSENQKQIEGLVLAGAQRLLARAAHARALDAAFLAPRLRAAVEKYVLKDNPSVGSAQIDKFLDGLHADDLCRSLASIS